MPTYLVTGCSSGIGLEIVRQLAARGETVYATCRKRESSSTGEDQISSIAGVKIIEGVDVATDECKAVLAKALEGVTLDVRAPARRNRPRRGPRRVAAAPRAVRGDATQGRAPRATRFRGHRSSSTTPAA